MSEIKKALHTAFPSKIYLDTSFLVDALIQTKENILRHKKACDFSELLKKSKTTIICSKLCYIEYWSAVFRIKTEELCGNNRLINIINSKTHIDSVFDWTKEQYNNLVLFFETLTKRPELKIEESVGIIEMPKKIDEKAREVAIKYKLPIYDSIHYYTMLITETSYIITDNIDDFRHLKKISILSYR